MKRKVILFACIMVLVFCAFVISYAEDEQGSGYAYEPDKVTYDNTPMSKLNRGVVNVATFWAEIPADVAKVSKEKDPLAGCTLGVAQGTFNAIVRGFTGVFDAVTFFAPPYNKPMMKPEYAVNRADDNIREYLW